MAKTAVLQVRLNEEDKRQAEELFESMGTSLAEATRIFVHQCILQQNLPFKPMSSRSKTKGAAYGMLNAYAEPSRIGRERNAWLSSLRTLPPQEGYENSRRSDR